MSLETTIEGMLPTAIGLVVAVVGFFAARSVKALDSTVNELRSDMREISDKANRTHEELMVVIERLSGCTRRCETVEGRLRKIERIGIFDDTK